MQHLLTYLPLAFTHLHNFSQFIFKTIPLPCLIVCMSAPCHISAPESIRELVNRRFYCTMLHCHYRNIFAESFCPLSKKGFHSSLHLTVKWQVPSSSSFLHNPAISYCLPHTREMAIKINCLAYVDLWSTLCYMPSILNDSHQIRDLEKKKKKKL